MNNAISNTSSAPEYFVSTWGYEQTNVTFYKVIKRTAKTVTVIEVKRQSKLGNTWGTYSAIPSDESPSWAKAMRKTIKNCSASKDPKHNFIAIHSFEHAYPWDGESVEGTSWA